MNYKEFPNYLFRTPMLSYNNLDNILLDEDTLIQNFTNEIIQEAIFLGSPILYNELQKLVNNEISNNKEKKKILLALSRYISRMSTRPTPFGLFAGCSIGSIGNSTQITLKNNSIIRKTRLDMHYLCGLYKFLVQIPSLRNKIVYHTNTTLYRIGNRFRYIETHENNLSNKHQLIELDYTTLLKNILKKAKYGIKIDTLIEYLNKQHITFEDANNYINELIDSQILLGELNQSVTGQNYLEKLIQFLENKNEAKIYTYLKDINEIISNLDKKGNIESYKKIKNKINDIGVSYEEKFLFQVDYRKETINAVLGKKVIDELKRSLIFLNKINSEEGNSILSEFKNEFHNRYGDEEVPLLEALDTEFGIGYPINKSRNSISPLVDDLLLPHLTNNSYQLNGVQILLLKKTIDCLLSNETEIIFTDEDVKEFEASWENFPASFYSVFELISDNPTLIRLKYAGGSSGGNLISRFAHIDNEIEDIVKEITEKEKEILTNKLLAEIAYLPESRTGNILFRPHIRDYEIVYMASSDKPLKQQLNLCDLTLSIKNGNIVIKSPKLKKEVIPFLTSAHNYMNESIPIYRFLCDVQTQNKKKQLLLDWGILENILPFRPRVRYRKTILSPKSWTFNIKDIKHLFNIENNGELITKIEEWRIKASLPVKVLMPDADNELLINWNNILSIRSLFSIIKNRTVIVFIEFSFIRENSPVKDESLNSYSNEFIINFYKDE